MMEHEDKKSEPIETDRGDGVEKDNRPIENIEALKLDKVIGEEKQEGIGELDADENKFEEKLCENKNIQQPDEGYDTTNTADFNKMILEQRSTEGDVQLVTFEEIQGNQANAFNMEADIIVGQSPNQEYISIPMGNTKKIQKLLFGNLETGIGNTTLSSNGKDLISDIDSRPSGSLASAVSGLNEENQPEAFNMEVDLIVGQSPNQEYSSIPAGHTTDITELLAHFEEQTRGNGNANTTLPGNSVGLISDDDVYPSGSRDSDALVLNPSHAVPDIFVSEVTARHTGVVVEIRQTFGFIFTSNDTRRVFFHFSDVMGNACHLRYGDLVQFKLTLNFRSGRSGACEVYKLSRSKPVSEERLVGFVASEIPTDSPEQQPGFIRYRSFAHSLFFPFFGSCVENACPLRMGDKVNFHIAANCSGTLHAYFVRLLSPGLVTFEQQSDQDTDQDTD